MSTPSVPRTSSEAGAPRVGHSGDRVPLRRLDVTQRATVVEVLKSPGEGGVVHRVRFQGKSANLITPSPIKVGTVVEVLVQHVGGEWIARLPGTGPIGTDTHSSSGPERWSLPESLLSTLASQEVNGEQRLRGETASEIATTGGVRSSQGNLPFSVRWEVERGDYPPTLAEVIARRLLQRGVEPTVALLKGGISAETSTGAASAAAAQRTLVETLESIFRVVEGSDSASASRSLASLKNLLSEVRIATSAQSIPERVVTELSRWVDSILNTDPRLVSVRTVIASILSDRSELPAARVLQELLLREDLQMAELGKGLSSRARAHGWELLRVMEQKIIEEHALFRLLRPALRDSIDTAQAWAYRSIMESTDRDLLFDQIDRDLRFANGVEQRWRIRVRRDAAEKTAGSIDSQKKFRIELGSRKLGAVVIEGVFDSGEAASVANGMVKVDLEFAARKAGVREAVEEQLPNFVTEVAKSGIGVHARTVSWKGKPPIESPSKEPTIEQSAPYDWKA